MLVSPMALSQAPSVLLTSFVKISERLAGNQIRTGFAEPCLLLLKLTVEK